MRVPRLLITAIIVLLVTSANAYTTSDKQKHVVAVCGPLKGMSYYMDPGKHGWQKETSIPLKIVFSRESEDKGDYQITFIPPSGKRYDLRDEGGGSINVVDNRALGTITLMVHYVSTLQPTVYHLKVAPDGKGEMMMQQLKSNPTTQHMSLLMGKCGEP